MTWQYDGSGNTMPFQVVSNCIIEISVNIADTVHLEEPASVTKPCSLEISSMNISQFGRNEPALAYKVAAREPHLLARALLRVGPFF
jgi:hypothetical protein